jgi:hypothetical protein
MMSTDCTESDVSPVFATSEVRLPGQHGDQLRGLGPSHPEAKKPAQQSGFRSRAGGIRTHDLLTPSQARYQAAPRPVRSKSSGSRVGAAHLSIPGPDQHLRAGCKGLVTAVELAMRLHIWGSTPMLNGP